MANRDTLVQAKIERYLVGFGIKTIYLYTRLTGVHAVGIWYVKYLEERVRQASSEVGWLKIIEGEKLRLEPRGTAPS